jgi:hypothetical protein
MLCNKLHGLEDSITELRNEISRNSQGQLTNNNHDPALYNTTDEQKQSDLNSLSNGDTSAPRFQRHAAAHGIHAKNELVRSDAVSRWFDILGILTDTGTNCALWCGLYTCLPHRNAQWR